MFKFLVIACLKAGAGVVSLLLGVPASYVLLASILLGLTGGAAWIMHWYLRDHTRALKE